MFWCEYMVHDKGKKSRVITLNLVAHSMISFSSYNPPNHWTPYELRKIDSQIISHNKTNVLK